MIKIYYVPTYGGGTREYKLIRQGLVNNPRVELVDSKEKSDFIFQFYYLSKHSQYYPHDLPAEKTVLIDYSDKVQWLSGIKCFAYFKRSWVKPTVLQATEGSYTTKAPIPRLPHIHPLTMAIMDEFIIEEEIERDVVLSYPLRIKRGNPNRARVLKLLEGMNIKGKTQIGEFTKGHMRRFNEPDMREYFKLLKRSRIVVTCNPSKWEGDHRTWEAFANGALVFVDRMWTPLTHPLIDGKHCIFYDLSDEGLMKLEHRILYFLENPTQTELIAKTGHDFTMRNHRASNRIDEILDVIV